MLRPLHPYKFLNHHHQEIPVCTAPCILISSLHARALTRPLVSTQLQEWSQPAVLGGEGGWLGGSRQLHAGPDQSSSEEAPKAVAAADGGRLFAKAFHVTRTVGDSSNPAGDSYLIGEHVLMPNTPDQGVYFTLNPKTLKP